MVEDAVRLGEISLRLVLLVGGVKRIFLVLTAQNAETQCMCNLPRISHIFPLETLVEEHCFRT